MDDRDWLAERFEAHRSHLRAVAYHMLGSGGEADDAVQEAWLRLSRTDPAGLGNLGGWLTTVVARVCLDLLRARGARHEEPLDDDLAGQGRAGDGNGDGPEDQALLAEGVGAALLVVLDTLGPAERLAFVLHDLFAVPFDEVARILDRSPAAARQLASRARRRVQGAAADPDPAADRARQWAVVDAFLAAAREGDFEALLALLDPDVVVRADASRVVRGARPVAGQALSFAGRARVASPALVDGAPGLVVAPQGRPRVALVFTIADGRILELEVISDPGRLAGLDLAFPRRLGGPGRGRAGGR
jgi:RNA polymerase sigma factor (sigma-70 family)